MRPSGTPSAEKMMNRSGKILPCFLAALLLFAAGSSRGAAKGDETAGGGTAAADEVALRVESYIREAKGFLAGNQYDEARDRALRAIRLCPDDGDAWFLLAGINQLTGERPEETLKALENYLEYVPDAKNRQAVVKQIADLKNRLAEDKKARGFTDEVPARKKRGDGIQVSFVHKVLNFPGGIFQATHQGHYTGIIAGTEQSVDYTQITRIYDVCMSELRFDYRYRDYLLGFEISCGDHRAEVYIQHGPGIPGPDLYQAVEADSSMRIFLLTGGWDPGLYRLPVRFNPVRLHIPLGLGVGWFRDTWNGDLAEVVKEWDPAPVALDISTLVTEAAGGIGMRVDLGRWYVDLAERYKIYYFPNNEGFTWHGLQTQFGLGYCF